MSTRPRVLFAVICFLALPRVYGQWIETVIPLPDSLGGLRSPVAVGLNTLSNRLFVPDGSLRRAVVLDCSTGQRVAAYDLPAPIGNVRYDPVRDKFYCLSQNLLVIDGTTYAVRRSIPLPTYTSDYIEIDPAAGKVYVGPHRFSSQPIVAVDCNGDTITGRIDSTDKFFCLSPPHNKLYVAWSDSSALAVVDCTSDSVVRLVRVPVAPYSMLYNPVSDKLYCAGPGLLCILAASSDSLLQTLPLGIPGELGFNPVANKVYCADLESRSVLVVSGQGDSVLARIDGLFAEFFVFDSTDNLMCSVCLDSSGGYFLGIIDGDTDSLVATVRLPHRVADMCFEPVRSRLYGAGPGEIVVVDARARAVADSLILWLSPAAMVHCADRNRVYFSAREQAAVGVIDCSQNRMTALLPSGRAPCAICHIPEANRVYCANEEDGTVTVIDCAAESVIATLTVGARPSGFCYVPAWNRLYCACKDDSVVTVIDVHGDSVRGRIRVARGPAALAYSPPSNRLYCTRYWDSTLTVVEPGPDTVVGAVGVIGLDHILCFVPTANQLACAGTFRGSALMVLDCASGLVTDTVWIGTGTEDVVYNRGRNKLYTADGTSYTMTVVDCATWRIDSFVGIEPNPIAVSYDSVADKVYVVSRNVLGTVAAVDCATNHVVSELRVGDSPSDALWNPRDGRTYVAVYNRSAIAILRDSTSGVPGQSPSISQQPGGASIVRGVLRLGGAGQSQCVGHTGLRDSPCASLLDAAGRRVMELRAGANDVRRLAPGVYFVREAAQAQAQAQAQAVRRVVVTR